MGGRLLLLLGLILGASRTAAGQTTAADGVAAIARGDYQLAVEILRPLAEDWHHDHPAAQFFMAGLYQTGRGVTLDPMRACALYARAAGGGSRPFGSQALRMFRSVATNIELDQECQFLANVGFETGFVPTTFDLGPGHIVEWTLAAITVSYRGERTREAMPFAVRGSRFWPLRHTMIPTGAARVERRHFLESFDWVPTASESWALRWRVFEVIGEAVRQIDVPESVASFKGPAPPRSPGTDVGDYAALRVNDSGALEWVSAGASGPATPRR